MPFFAKKYTLRRYDADKIVNGHLVSGYNDITVILDVQTVSDRETLELAGSRDIVLLKTFGDFPIRTSKQEKGERADHLLFRDRWYKCVSSRLSDNTIIRHWTSTFELIPDHQEGGE